MGHHTLPIKRMHLHSIKQTHRTRSSTTVAGAPEPCTNWLWHMNRMGQSPSASCECGAVRPLNTSPANVRYIVLTGTWSCWTRQPASGFATCSVTYNKSPTKRKKKTSLRNTCQLRSLLRVATNTCKLLFNLFHYLVASFHPSLFF